MTLSRLSLANYSKFYLKGVVTYAAWKTPLAGLEYYPNALPSTDILSSETKGQWRDTALLLMNNRNDRIIDNFSNETDPQFKVTFNRQSAVAFGGFYPEEPARSLTETLELTFRDFETLLFIPKLYCSRSIFSSNINSLYK